MASLNFFLLVSLVSIVMTTLWLPVHVRQRTVLGGVVVLVVAGLTLGALRPMALLWIGLLFAAAWLAGLAARGAARDVAVWLRGIAWVGVVLLSLGIGFGLLPGFVPMPLGAEAPLKPDSRSIVLQIGLGKPLVALVLLLWLVPVASGPAAWGRLLARTAPLIMATAVGVPALAWALGHVHPAFGLPPLPVTLAWMAINLFAVCVVEDAFFRGLLQRALTQRLPAGAAISLSALLFGLAHAGGGWSLVVLATVAGAGYGLAYHRSGQHIEAAILAHFGVNLTHFLFFTYPA